MTMSEDSLKQKLSQEEYDILRKGGTEPAYSGKYVDLKEDGMYHCKACGAPLFSSETKFDSGTGWPSFTDVANANSVLLHDDTSLGIKRVEVTCATCKSHLGHVFDDGPIDKGGKRYCVNSLALNFEKE